MRTSASARRAKEAIPTGLMETELQYARVRSRKSDGGQSQGRGAPKRRPPFGYNARMLSKRDRWVLALLVISAFINYIDRANLSVGAVTIQRELGLSSLQLGRLLSGFFWTYAALQLFFVAGWLADRFNVSLVFAAGFLVWSGATAGAGLAGAFTTLFMFRLLLGAGESIAYPCYSRILAAFPEHRRGLANALVDAGTKLGPALGTLLGGLMMAHFGWRIFFMALGFGSLLWLAPWLYWAPRGYAAPAKAEQAETPSLLDILRQRSAWFSFLGLFCSQLLLVFSAHLAAGLSRKGTRLPQAQDGGAGLAGVLRRGRLDGCLRVAVGPLDRPGRLADARPQDVRRSGPDIRHDSSAGLRRARRRGGHGAAFAGVHRLWPVQLQSLGHHPDAGRPARRGQMDRHAERRGEPGWSGGALVHRLGGGADRQFLCRVPGCGHGGSDGRRGFRVRHRAGPAGGFRPKTTGTRLCRRGCSGGVQSELHFFGLKS